MKRKEERKIKFEHTCETSQWSLKEDRHRMKRKR